MKTRRILNELERDADINVDDLAQVEEAAKICKDTLQILEELMSGDISACAEKLEVIKLAETDIKNEKIFSPKERFALSLLLFDKRINVMIDELRAKAESTNDYNMKVKYTWLANTLGTSYIIFCFKKESWLNLEEDRTRYSHQLKALTKQKRRLNRN